MLRLGDKEPVVIQPQMKSFRIGLLRTVHLSSAYAVVHEKQAKLLDEARCFQRSGEVRLTHNLHQRCS